MEIAILGRYPHSDGMRDRLIAMEALTLARAVSLAERDITTLSGGELARVQFARIFGKISADKMSTAACNRSHATCCWTSQPIHWTWHISITC